MDGRGMTSTSTTSITPTTTSTSTTITTPTTTSTSTSTTSTSTTSTTPTTTSTSTTSTTPTTTSTSTTTTTTTLPTSCCPAGGIWSEWTAAGTCGDTCGSCAQLTYTRECLTDSTTCPCNGTSSVIRNCATNVCYYPRLSCCAPYKSMVVNSTFQCGPQPVEPAGPVLSKYCCQQSGFWAPWGTWSDCTGGTCGTCGTSTRNRTCYSTKWGCACEGNSTESMTCRTVGTWSEWTVETACPAAPCGSCNMQKLTRNCSSTTCPCFGDSTVYRNCNAAPCTTNGTVVTNATCCSPYTLQDPNGNNLTTCGPAASPTPSPSPMTCGGNASCCAIGGVWSEWSAGGTCSDTCGNCGTTTKTRFCTSMDYGCPCSGPTAKQAECGNTVCLYPRNSCCGTRQKIIDQAANTFVCSNSDDTSPPPSNLCWTCCPASGGYWSEWSGGTACSDTCGSCGNTTQTRQCLTTAQNCSCIGASTRIINCNIGVCYYPRLSCCTPYSSMVSNSSFICGPQPNYTTPYAPYDENCTLPPPTCCQPGGSWSEWTADRQCTDYCGACGNVTYTRTCLSTASGCPCTGSSNYSTQCNTGVCYYPRLSCIRLWSYPKSRGVLE